MPPEKRWGSLQERDLAIAIIMSHAGDRPKYNWEKVTEIMNKWGHDFTRDAINQHWSKRIMKEFKERHGEAAAKGGPSAADTASDSPNSTIKSAGTRPPGSGKRKKGTVAAAMASISPHSGDKDDVPEDYGCDGGIDNTPTKRQRKMKVEDTKDEQC